MAKVILKSAAQGLSATREHIPSLVAGAASQSKAFATEQFPRTASIIAGSAQENPLTATGVAAGLAIVCAPAIVSAPALILSGFGGTGVGAGTIAAGIQSGIGNVAASSAFATLQSAGAGGAGLAIINGAVQIGGGVMAVASPAVAIVKSKL